MPKLNFLNFLSSWILLVGIVMAGVAGWQYWHRQTQSPNDLNAHNRVMRMKVMKDAIQQGQKTYSFSTRVPPPPIAGK